MKVCSVDIITLILSCQDTRGLRGLRDTREMRALQNSKISYLSLVGLARADFQQDTENASLATVCLNENRSEDRENTITKQTCIKLTVA